jgi:cyclase
VRATTTGREIVIAAAGLFWMIGPSAPIVRSQSRNEELDIVRLRPNFYMIAGAGSNIAVQIGPDGVVLVDAGLAEASDRVLEVIRKLAGGPVRYIINTSAEVDHVGGNGKISRAGQSILAMGTQPLGGEFGRAMTGGYAAAVVAAESVLARMSAPTDKTLVFPNDTWPTESFTEKRRSIYLNHEGIDIFRQPAAHSDGDSIVFFRASDIVAAGDIIDAARFPVIDLEKGGSIQGEIEALNHVIELAVRPVPFFSEEAGTYVLPGHGRVYDQADTVEYRDMIVIIRDVIEDMITRHMTLEQIKAASPAKPYEPRYGAASGSWTTNDFVEAIYRSLTGKK